MTVVTSTSRSGPYAGAGTTGPFTVNFRFLDATHLRVIRTDNTGEHVLVLTTDYTVAGVGNPTGSVTLVAALPVGQTLTIIRDVPKTQEADYVQNDDFPAESHETALDKLTMIAQQVGEQVTRTITFPASDSEALGKELPTAPLRANKALIFKPDGSVDVSADDYVNQAANAAASAAAAAASAASASSSANSAAASYDSFDDRWLGPKAADPTLDNDGNALLEGAAYWNIGGSLLKVWSVAGAVWTAINSFVQGGVGAVTRTWQSKARDFISVKDFGAKGDNVNDDTSAFLNAFAYALSLGGGIVYVPPGTYKITSLLQLPLGVSLMGHCGAHAFAEVSPVAVSQLSWAGSVGGTMLTTVAKWAGRIEGILLEGNWSAAKLFNPVSCGGSLFQNFHGQHSTDIGWDWSTDTVNPSALNTIVNCHWHDHANIAFQMGGEPTSPVTLNTFVGCRFNGNNISLRIVENADTNFWYGGRVENGTSVNSKGLVVNEAGSDRLVDSLIFYGTTFDGNNIVGSAMCAIGHWTTSPPSGGGNTVVAFRDCHFTSSTTFNSVSEGANIKLVDCPGVASMFPGAAGGDYAHPVGISPGASPYTYTNNDPFAVNVVVQGGTVSQIALVRAGVTTNFGLTSGVFRLEPGDGLSVTYTVAPGAFLRYHIS